jgi:hypothetical protein
VPSLPFTHQPFAGDTDRFDGIRTMSTGFFEASKTMALAEDETPKSSVFAIALEAPSALRPPIA